MLDGAVLSAVVAEGVCTESVNSSSLLSFRSWIISSFGSTAAAAEAVFSIAVTSIVMVVVVCGFYSVNFKNLSFAFVRLCRREFR